jgi:DNA invertase Pin-like site-specific DNA recombinase
MSENDKKMIVGYARVSTPTQRLDRQIANLKQAYPDIVIVSEVYTGTTDKRPKWQKLIRQCHAGIISKIVFDEVSRFGRNAEEAISTYKELYNLGIELEFLKEPHINLSVYREALTRKINISTESMDDETAKLIDTVIDGLNDYLFAIAEKQVFLAFNAAQAERDLLSKRTSEGLKQAKLLGSKVGRQEGQVLVTKKSKKAKKIIRKYYKLFGGNLSATQTYAIANITKSTFYRYLEQMREEDVKNGITWPDELPEDDKNCSKEDIIKLIKEQNSVC